MSHVIGLLVGFAALALAFAVIERFHPAVPGQRRWRRGVGTDIGYWLLTPLISKNLAAAGVLVVIALLALAHGGAADRAAIERIVHPDSWVSHQPLWLQALAALVVGDFIGYWLHRAFHRCTLWPIHAVHHGSTEVDWLSAVRLHPLNALITRMAQVVPLVLLGFPAGVLAGVVPALSFFAIFLHANVSWDFGPLRWIVASPAFHRWHHSSDADGLDRNFAGFFPAWDLLFGTFHLPRDRRPTRFGVIGSVVPEGLWGQLLYPFRRASSIGQDRR
jgi:sterol desaturase/sphingolipid hydroxylase (fatty acid hydroxylase superfamily)